MPAGVALRLAVMAVAFAALAPAQCMLIRFAPARAGLLPMLYHRLFLRLFGIRVTESGERPGGRATLVLANHVSWLDIVVIGALVPACFVAKSDVSRWPVIRTFARLQRTIFVDRARRTQTGGVNAAIARRLAEGGTVVLFAEGTTGDGLRVLPFRSALIGAAEGRHASSALRVQPLALAYVGRNGLALGRRDRPAIAWYGDMELVPHLAAFLRGGPVDVVVRWLPPLPEALRHERKAAAGAAEAAVRGAVQAIVRDGPKAPAGRASSFAILSRRQKA